MNKRVRLKVIQFGEIIPRGGKLVKKAILSMAIFDIFIIAAIACTLIEKNLFLSSIVSVVSALGFFSFRVYDIEQLNDTNSQIIRTFISSFLSTTLVAVIFMPKNYITFSEILLFSAASSAALSFFHRLYYPVIRRFLKRKIYYLPESEYYRLKPILDEIHEKSLGSIIFTTDPYNHNSVLILHEKMKAPAGENTVFLPDLAEKYLKRIPVEILRRFEQYYEVCFSNTSESPAKRVLDIAVSVVGLIVFSPIMAIISIAILVEDGLPVIFRQERVGKDEKPFVMLKFRSLDKKEKNPGFDAEERMLKIGKIMRKFRIDEVPQFINVLKGEMSVIGPRPEMKVFHNEMKEKIPFYEYRLKRKPGITGWAQINYKHTTTFEDYVKKTEYDLWYVKNRNILLDLRIILQTVETMLGMRGAK